MSSSVAWSHCSHNASANKQLLLHQRAQERRAGWAWYTASITDGYLNVQSHTNDEWWATADTPAEREPWGRGSDGVTSRVHGRDASDRHHRCNWRQLAAARATAAGCGDWQAVAHLHRHWHPPRLTQSVGWNGEISGAVYMGRSLYCLARARCEGGDLMR